MKYKLTLFLSLIVFSGSACSNPKMNGEIYLTGRDGQVQRVAGAYVYVYKAEDFGTTPADDTARIKAETVARKSAFDAEQACRAEARSFARDIGDDPDYFYCLDKSNQVEFDEIKKSLPDSYLAIETMTTDSDGKFSVQLPPGKYVIIATVDRPSGQHTLPYLFIEKIDTKDASKLISINASSLVNHPRDSQRY